ncbi:DUF3179 domain-containing protein [Maribius pontilimi]|uniref:DUF3179 domain-containing protein n=1 Tax=Palleronia pontilimi TaxID=1964209 RepID=A0A934MEI1_9RHOB|nr:DUF3179 domain-containing protein [Palleronia pontilimi]MBJ3763471.1 DUF3179 domain-containing protein [Palleronia pontilimi]
MLKRLMLLLALATPVQASPDIWSREWPDTDFSQTTVTDWSEIRSGGPGKDGIPAIHDPRFAPVDTVQDLDPREPVLSLALEGETPRAYPIRYLMWHEIVNDRIGDMPVAVTFCPLCNSGKIFDRRVDGRLLSFGVTGKLRYSDMVMYDRETQSWWQQAVGRGIVGEMTGARLTDLAGVMESWEQYRDAHPDGLVMLSPGFARDYGRNPYVNYDSAARPFLYDGDPPPHGIAPLARVVAVGGRAWPLERVRAAGRIEEAGVRLSWEEGQASALDTGRIGQGREVGTVRVVDDAGMKLPYDVMFAFAFDAFFPDGQWMLGR